MTVFIVIVRDFILHMVNSLLSVLRVLLLSNWQGYRVPGAMKELLSRECIILGNGPSLKEALKQADRFHGRTKICVNYFGRTEEFERIKPEIYLIASPEYFLKDDKQEYQDSRIETFRAINEKTTWPMMLVVPQLARRQRAWQSYFTNPNIHLVYFNNTPIEGFQGFKNVAYRLRLGMPRPHNVLVACVWFAINLQFAKVYLLGADHSWLNEISVTQDNEVLIGQKHFYDQQVTQQQNQVNKPAPKPMYKGTSNESRKLHEVIEKFFLSFRSYWELKAFARYRAVEVINLTEGSFIDAFEKQSIDVL